MWYLNPPAVNAKMTHNEGNVDGVLVLLRQLHREHGQIGALDHRALSATSPHLFNQLLN